ncbi:MAG: zinc ribbon domain-containing protein [Chloroflexi bacterium]|nr:zinc ribbon domain-containing protein [Chloroflexota bacterium]
MPIYEYICQDCQYRFDARRSMADADRPIACPKCGGTHARRGLSRFMVIGGGAAGSSEFSAGGSGGGCSGCSGGSCSSCGH